MLKIIFKYKDIYTKGDWRIQECIMPSLQECINIYGLGTDCEYIIISEELI